MNNSSNNQINQNSLNDQIRNEDYQISLNNSIDVFFNFFLTYQKALENTNNRHLGSFKNHYRSNYETIKQFL
jgi:hypothetical protein